MIELIVTIVVIGLIVLAVTSLYITINSTQRSARLLETATRAGEQQVESLRNNNYTLLTVGQTIDFTSQLPASLPTPRNAQVIVGEPIPGVKRVDVTIQYRDTNRDRTVKFSSLIGQIGIGGQ